MITSVPVTKTLEPRPTEIRRPANNPRSGPPHGRVHLSGKQWAAEHPRLRYPLRALYRDDHLLRTGHLLTLSSLTTSVIGLLYWAVATRTYGAATVGASYAAVSAMTFIAAIGQFNLDAVLTRFVPSAGTRARRLVTSAYAAATLGALVVATAFVLLVPAISSGLAFLHAPALGAAFVLGTVAYAIFVLQDGALTGLRRPGWIVLENACFALAKIALIIFLARTALRPQGILLSWIIALVATIIVTNSFLYRRINRPDRSDRAAGPLRAARPDPARSPGPKYIAADYTGQMFWMAAMSLPPIMVLDRLDAAQSAYFSLALLMAHMLFMVSINMGLSLVVEAARDPHRIDGFRRMLKHTGLLLAGCVAVLAAAAPLILRIFGPQYAQDGTVLLRLLALSALPNLVIVTAVSIARSEQRMRIVVVIYGSVSFLVLGLTEVLVPVMGISGAGAAWLIGLTVVAAALLVRRDLWLPHTASIAVPTTPTELTELTSPNADFAIRGTSTTGASATGTPTLSVVICAFTMDRWDDLSASLASLRSQVRPPDEIILVIDHCAPLAKRAWREFGGIRDVGVIESTEPPGLSGARNTGVRAAGSDVVAFLDDDAVADRRWTEHLLAPYADPEVLGVGGLVQPAWDRRRPAWFPTEFDWVVGCTYRGMPTTRSRVRNFIGANMSFRRDVLTRLEGFRHDLGRIGTRPLGGEETELCIRAIREHPSGRLVYEPAATVRHRVPARRGTWGYFRARCYAEGLSKAAVRGHAGSGPALESERSYLRRTIPSGLVRPLRLGPDRPRWMTSIALTVGVAWTVAGYCAGRVSALLRPLKPTALPAETTVRKVDRIAKVVGLAALPTALGLWIYSLSGIQLSAISDLGLITAVPTAFWAALGVLILGFAVTICGRARISSALPAGYVIGLIAILHATPALVYPTLRYAWAWKHVAIVDFMTAHGAVASVPSSTPMAAYSQWPGFFALNALLVEMTGARSADSYAAWGPPLFNALMIVPLLLLFRSITTRRRLVWAAVWVYFSCSWVGQDYFSPQAYVLVLYVVFLAVVVRRIVAPPPGRPDPPGPVRTRPRPCARLPKGELAVLLLVAAAIDSSHQLTPIMLVTAVAVLAVKRRYRRALLPLLIGSALLAVGWDATIARPFIDANLHSLIQALGDLDANAGSGLISLASVSADQVLIAWIDRALTAIAYLLAVAALIRWPHLRRSPICWLALCPIVLLAMSNYGGEIVFRVYLFALPALALLAAAILVPAAPEANARQGRPARVSATARRVALPMMFAALLSGFVFAYYGKEKANYFTPDEVAAAQYLYSHVKPGEVILAPNDDFPDAYTNYPSYQHIWFAEQDPGVASLVAADPVRELITLAASSPDLTAYVILTQAQAAEVSQTGALPTGAFAAMRTALESSPASTVVYQNADAQVFRLSLAPAATTATPQGTE
jgi:O-antigen/teichoic acid export membrane protein/GT2 family glycosyltransferase